MTSPGSPVSSTTRSGTPSTTAPSFMQRCITVAAFAGFPQPAQPRMGGERGAYPGHAERLAVVEIRRHQPVRTGQDEDAATGAHLVEEGEELHGPLPG